MSLNALRQGSHIKIGAARFLVLQKLSANSWQLQNTETGEWCKFTEDELLDQFARNELCLTAALRIGVWKITPVPFNLTEA